MRTVLMRSIVVAAAALSVVVVLSCGDDDPAGNAPTGAISGTVTFRNPWPMTGSVYVTVNSAYPPTGAPDAFTSPIPTGVRTHDYTIPGVEVGTYVAILIGWRGGPGEDKCIGMYWEYVDSLGVEANCNSQAPGPSPVTVTKGGDTQNIDMVADLNLAN